MTNHVSEAARELASQRRVYKKRCPICGVEFSGTARRIYNTRACQVKAYRNRLKDREKQEV